MPWFYNIQAIPNVKFAGNISGILDLVLLPWDRHINPDLVFSSYDIHTIETQIIQNIKEI